MADISPSIADLYRAAANPMRTNTQNIDVDETPFVSSRNDSVNEEDSLVDDSSNESRSSASRRSTNTRQRNTREPSFVEESNFVKSYVSRRSGAFGQRVDTMRNNPFVQQEREREKTHYLHELNRMKMNGSLPSRPYTQEDDVADLAFECSRIKSNEDQVSMVSFMKDAIKLSTTGVELINNKFNILRLDGWSREVTRDMERYNRPLSKIYQRYWRKGSVSPFVELAFLLGGSLVVHHFKNLLTGGGGAAPPPSTANSAPAPSRNVPFNIPTGQQTVPESANNANKRAPMRRPMRSARESVSQPQGPPDNLIEQILQGQQVHQFSRQNANQISQQNANQFSQQNANQFSQQTDGAHSNMPPILPGMPNVGMVVIDVQQSRQRRMSVPEVEVVDDDALGHDVLEHRIDIQEDDNIRMSSGNNGLSFDMA